LSKLNRDKVMIAMRDYTKRAIKHFDNEQPVTDGSIVCYRTLNQHGDVSHIHRPVCAWIVNWGGVFQGQPLMIGKIYDYVVMDRKEINTRFTEDGLIAKF